MKNKTYTGFIILLAILSICANMMSYTSASQYEYTEFQVFGVRLTLKEENINNRTRFYTGTHTMNASDDYLMMFNIYKECSGVYEVYNQTFDLLYQQNFTLGIQSFIRHDRDVIIEPEYYYFHAEIYNTDNISEHIWSKVDIINMDIPINFISVLPVIFILGLIIISTMLIYKNK